MNASVSQLTFFNSAAGGISAEQARATAFGLNSFPAVNPRFVPTTHYHKKRGISKPVEVKKIVIKNMRASPVISITFIDKSFEKLRDAVVAIQRSQPIKHSLEELYQAVEDICSHKLDKLLYIKLAKLIAAHVKRTSLFLRVGTIATPLFVKKITAWWSSFGEQINLIQNIFLYLDRTYVKRNNMVRPIGQMAVFIFRHNVVLNQHIQQQAVEALGTLIEEEREGFAVDRELVRNLVNMLCDLNIYSMGFDSKYLIATKFHRIAKRECKLQIVHVPEYLQHN